ncbi:MAG: hypothetical protein AAF335_00185, partial [Bacteroidota bacterium]
MNPKRTCGHLLISSITDVPKTINCNKRFSPTAPKGYFRVISGHTNDVKIVTDIPTNKSVGFPIYFRLSKTPKESWPQENLGNIAHKT